MTLPLQCEYSVSTYFMNSYLKLKNSEIYLYLKVEYCHWKLDIDIEYWSFAFIEYWIL